MFSFPSRMPSPVVLIGGLLLAGLALVACDGDESKQARSTATAPAIGPAPPTADEGLLPEVAEVGEAPVFWRLGEPQPMRADTDYKVVVRVTNGFDEETLRIVGSPVEGGEPVEFAARRAVPTGPDDPGSYYVFTLRLPAPGAWQVIAHPDEEASITIQVGA